MSRLRLIKTELPEASLIEPEPARDERGSFARTFCARVFAEHGLETNFVQHSISQTRFRGTVRGLHFQKAEHVEVKVVSCIRGAIWDVIVDLRRGSPTFSQWLGVKLTAENRRQLYVPKGFAHGFQTLCDDVDVNYLISAFYTPEAAAGIRHDDPHFGIKWPSAPTVISEKDLTWPDFDPAVDGYQS